MLKAVTARYTNPTRLVGLFLIFFSPALAYFWIGASGNALLIEDGILQSFPFRAFLHSAYVNGFSPQWVPFSACGFSLLAEGQNGICFPVTQIFTEFFPPRPAGLWKWYYPALPHSHFASFCFGNCRSAGPVLLQELQYTPSATPHSAWKIFPH